MILQGKGSKHPHHFNYIYQVIHPVGHDILLTRSCAIFSLGGWLVFSVAMVDGLVRERTAFPFNADFRLNTSGIGYPGPWVGTWFHFVTHRDDYPKMHYFADVMASFRSQPMNPGDRILVLALPDSQVFPFLLDHPEAETRVIDPGANRGQQIAEIRRSDFVLVIGRKWEGDWPRGRILLSVPENLSGRTPVEFRALR